MEITVTLRIRMSDWVDAHSLLRRIRSEVELPLATGGCSLLSVGVLLPSITLKKEDHNPLLVAGIAGRTLVVPEFDPITPPQKDSSDAKARNRQEGEERTDGGLRKAHLNVLEDADIGRRFLAAEAGDPGDAQEGTPDVSGGPQRGEWDI